MLTIALLITFLVVVLNSKRGKVSFDGCVSIILLSITSIGDVMIVYYICMTVLRVLAK